MVEDFELEDPENEHDQARAHGAATAGMDEDDDDVPGGAERVQCASQ
jgi:DnaJ family protein A protein 2